MVVGLTDGAAPPPEGRAVSDQGPWVLSMSVMQPACVPKHRPLAPPPVVASSLHLGAVPAATSVPLSSAPAASAVQSTPCTSVGGVKGSETRGPLLPVAIAVEGLGPLPPSSSNRVVPLPASYPVSPPVCGIAGVDLLPPGVPLDGDALLLPADSAAAPSLGAGLSGAAPPAGGTAATVALDCSAPPWGLCPPASLAFFGVPGAVAVPKPSLVVLAASRRPSEQALLQR